eukprot:2398115-Rhodomonas_salina.4
MFGTEIRNRGSQWMRRIRQRRRSSGRWLSLRLCAHTGMLYDAMFGLDLDSAYMRVRYATWRWYQESQEPVAGQSAPTLPRLSDTHTSTNVPVCRDGCLYSLMYACAKILDSGVPPTLDIGVPLTQASGYCCTRSQSEHEAEEAGQYRTRRRKTQRGPAFSLRFYPEVE